MSAGHKEPEDEISHKGHEVHEVCDGTLLARHDGRSTRCAVPPRNSSNTKLSFVTFVIFVANPSSWSSWLRVAALALVAALAASGSVALGQAPVVNARVERRPAAQGLAREVQAVVDRGMPAWIGYRVPIFRRADLRVSTADTCCGRCRLEPPTELVVLARVESRTILELRPVAVDCDIDGNGMPLVWLENVNPDESVAWLSSLAQGAAAPSRRAADAAVVAIAQHASPAAAPALVRFAREAATPRARGQALFWLAQRAADQALPAIDTTLAQDPDTEVKKQAVFALSRFPRGEGIPRLMEVARTHPNVDVRRQAMFWLGQSKDPRAIDFFARILLE